MKCCYRKVFAPSLKSMAIGFNSNRHGIAAPSYFNDRFYEHTDMTMWFSRSSIPKAVARKGPATVDSTLVCSGSSMPAFTAFFSFKPVTSWIIGISAWGYCWKFYGQCFSPKSPSYCEHIRCLLWWLFWRILLLKVLLKSICLRQCFQRILGGEVLRNLIW